MPLVRVAPQNSPLLGIVDPPSSKNYTLRYVLAACLAHGRCVVHRPAIQDDAVALVKCLRQLGARIEARTRSGEPTEFSIANAASVDHLEIHGFASEPSLSPDERTINPDNAGAVLRMLMSVAVLVPGPLRFETHHLESLGKRPNGDLLRALEQLGVRVHESGSDGRLPLVLEGGRDHLRAHIAKRRRAEGIAEDRPVPIEVSGAVSSQFLSSLLFMAPLLDEHLLIRVPGELKSSPLVALTVGVMREAGIVVKSTPDWREHEIVPGQQYRPADRTVNGDWPGSAAILAAAAVVSHSRIRVRRLRDDAQGERRCLEFYRAMGCEADYGRDEQSDFLRFASPARLRAASIDGDLCTDAVLAMAGAAALAEGTSEFTGIANLQFKECDRVREPIAELRRIAETAERLSHGLRPDEAFRWEPNDNPDAIRITGAPEGYPGGIRVHGRGDHRVIMQQTIVGLRCANGLEIEGAQHVAKSFPTWFDVVAQMRGAR
jgi:3-phosphoshikimate 1-carboxyvinyltransferase